MYAMFFFFFFNDTATTEIYTLSLHDALPIYLARLDDLVSEVQTQVRSLARQRGKAERYGEMIEERFGIALTLVRRELEDLDLELGRLGTRASQLAAALPEERARLVRAEREREARVQARHTAEARRTAVERRLAEA